MKNIIFLIFALFIFNSCSDELITIVDEYNPPYEVKAIPGDNSISISFWSGVLANDFAGFNLYISTTQTFTNALTGLDGRYPTVRETTHTRTNFTLNFPQSLNLQNDTLYYVGVTAYGTNELAEGGKIETKVVAIPVVPRQEQPNTMGSFSLNNNNVSVNINNAQIKSYGPRTNFNEITSFTNNGLSSSIPYYQNYLYIASDGQNLYKLWNNTYATINSQNGICNTI